MSCSVPKIKRIAINDTDDNGYAYSEIVILSGLEKQQDFQKYF